MDVSFGARTYQRHDRYRISDEGRVILRTYAQKRSDNFVGGVAEMIAGVVENTGYPRIRTRSRYTLSPGVVMN